MRDRLAVELLRLRHDVALAGSLAFLLIPALGAAAALPHDGPADARAAELLAGSQLLSQAVLFIAAAAVYGSLRYTNDYRTGAIARAALLGPRSRLLWDRAVSAAAGGALIGLVGTALVATVLGLGSGHTGLTAQTVLGTPAACATAGVWGLFVGTMVRHHLLTLFVVPTTLFAALPVLAARPAVGRLLPLGAQLGMITAPDRAPWTGLLPAPYGALVAAAWLVAVGVLARVLLTRRDLV
ncbi:hypothetical protein ACIRYZ_01410 [Kitasatospora sp. NPDC101155]|uniref:hypothetical protein n=1 Tax=Kitasatospora sp. NPDC101155 TaxID=3364097 RepID=UPI00380029A1